MYRLLYLFPLSFLLTGCSFWTRSPFGGDNVGQYGVSNHSSWFFVATVVVIAALMAYRWWLDRRVTQ